VQAIQPAGASAEDQSSRASVRNNAGGKGEPHGLRRNIDGTKKAPTAESRAAICFINAHFPHPAEINHQSAITTAKSGKAVATTTDSGKNTRCTGLPHSSLHIRHSCATGDQTRHAGNHPIPNATCFGEFGVAGTQQIAAELIFQ
jgi:hypothetical protein